MPFPRPLDWVMIQVLLPVQQAPAGLRGTRARTLAVELVKAALVGLVAVLERLEALQAVQAVRQGMQARRQVGLQVRPRVELQAMQGQPPAAAAQGVEQVGLVVAQETPAAARRAPVARLGMRARMLEAAVAIPAAATRSSAPNCSARA